MRIDAKNNFAFPDSSSFKQVSELENQSSYGGLHQQILLGLINGLKTQHDIIESAKRLVTLAEQNYFQRRMEIVELISQALINLPLPESFKQVGQYHLTMCIKHQGRRDEAHERLEFLADNISHRYKSRAILSLAGMAFNKSDYQSALPLYVEAGRVAGIQESQDPSVNIIAQRMIAVLKSIDGDHRGALVDLENLFPLVRAVGRWQPHLFYEHLNSLAVELSELGRLEEAQRASDIALACPYASAYPTWHETRDEIAMKSQRASRAFITNVKLPVVVDNVVHLTFAGYTGNTNSPQSFNTRSQPARVINFEEWNKMSKEKDGNPQETPSRSQTQQMTLSEKQAKLLRLIYDDNVSEDLLDKLLKTAEEVALTNQANN
jgi:tetratricopeptide (TPR) repeat protein